QVPLFFLQFDPLHPNSTVPRAGAGTVSVAEHQLAVTVIRVRYVRDQLVLPVPIPVLVKRHVHHVASPSCMYRCGSSRRSTTTPERCVVPRLTYIRFYYQPISLYDYLCSEHIHRVGREPHSIFPPSILFDQIISPNPSERPQPFWHP